MPSSIPAHPEKPPELPHDSSARTDICPLCRGEQWIELREIAIAPIVRYWRALGYRLENDVDPLPHSLVQRRCLRCAVHWFSPMLVGSAGMYAALTHHDWYYDTQKWEFREALGFLAEHRPDRLLEIGCGTGAFLKQAQRFCGSVHGLEYSTEAVAACRRNGLNVHERNLPEEEAPFHAVAAFQVLEHVPDPEATLEAWIARLAPDGYLIIGVPNQNGVLGILDDNYLNLPPHHTTRWEKKSLQYIAERFRLEMLHYRQEPLNVELYAAYTQHVLRQTQVRPGLVGRVIHKLTSLAHRAAIPFFFDDAARRFDGHTHLAVYRRPKN